MDVTLLHEIINEGLSMQGAMQQGCPEEDFPEQLEDIVKDVAAALLGRHIKIGRKLPYPGNLGKTRCTKTGKRI